MKKILFSRTDRFGEFLLSLYAVKLVKVNYPEAAVFMLAGKENSDLVRGADFIDRFLEYSEEAFSGVRGIIRLTGMMRRIKPDCLISMNPKKEIHAASFLAGIPVRVGYDRKLGFCLNTKIKDEKGLKKSHEIRHSINLVSKICKNVFIPEIDLPIDGPGTLDFLKGVVDMGRQYVVIHPFTSHTPKKIGRDFWVKFANEVRTRLNSCVVMVGGKEDIEEAAMLEGALRAHNLVGRLSMRQLASFMKSRTRFFAGLDSGPMHLAAMLKVPLAGLFSATDPSRWGPYCPAGIVKTGKSTEDFIKGIDDIMNFAEKAAIKK